MTAKRLLAFVAAVVLIVGAVLVRSALNDSWSSSGGSASGKYTIICSTEFADLCNALNTSKYTVIIKPAGTTLDDLAKIGATMPDAWLTLDPFPAMLDNLRSNASLDPSILKSTALATTGQRIAVITGKSKDLTTLCGATSIAACLPTAEGQPWSAADAATVKPGLANPLAEASGLLAFGDMVAGYQKSTAINPNPFDDAFTSWVHAAKSGLIQDPDPLNTLIIRPSAVNVAFTNEAELSTITETAQQAKFTTLSPDPSFAMTVVLATFSNRGGSPQTTLTKSLLQAGWAAPTPGAASLDPGTFNALRQLWKG